MHLVQILLPLYDNDGHLLERELFVRVRRELTERFGGITACVRSPAEGFWKEPGGEVVHDDVVSIEVMVENLDHVWWGSYRSVLEERFKQESIVVRAILIETL